jgi:hypothetical protein
MLNNGKGRRYIRQNLSTRRLFSTKKSERRQIRQGPKEPLKNHSHCLWARTDLPPSIFSRPGWGGVRSVAGRGFVLRVRSARRQFDHSGMTSRQRVRWALFCGEDGQRWGAALHIEAERAQTESQRLCAAGKKSDFRQPCTALKIFVLVVTLLSTFSNNSQNHRKHWIKQGLVPVVGLEPTRLFTVPGF